MKSAVFYGVRDMRIEEGACPEPGAGEVLIEVKACGVCGTDVHIYEGDKGAADCTPPTVLGHEFSGVISAVGQGVSEVSVGDRVCVDPNDLCGKCYYCKTGTGHFCTGIRGIGTTVNGGFAQFCAVPAKQVYRLDDTTSFEEGAMAEPVACCLHGIDLCGIRPGSSVAVIGGGMIGLLMLQLARISGAHTLVLIEPVAGKRVMGKQFGADLCINPFEENAGDVLKRHGLEQLDTVIECAGLTGTIEQAIEIAGRQSVVMMFGLTRPDDTVSVRPFEIFQKEVVLKSSFINPYTQQRAVDLINAKKIDVSSMVCSVSTLEELPGILSDAALRAKGKYIINPWQL